MDQRTGRINSLKFILFLRRSFLTVLLLTFAAVGGVAWREPVHALSVETHLPALTTVTTTVLPQSVSDPSTAAPSYGSRSSPVTSVTYNPQKEDGQLPTSVSRSDSAPVAVVAPHQAFAPIYQTTDLPLVPFVDPATNVQAVSSSGEAKLTAAPSQRISPAAPLVPFGMLVSSERGWRIFNLLWYWWVVGLGAGGIVFRLLLKKTQAKLLVS